MDLNGFYTDNIKKGLGILVEVIGKFGFDRYMVVMMHEGSKLSDPNKPAPLSITPEDENEGVFVVEVNGERVYLGESAEVKLYHVNKKDNPFRYGRVIRDENGEMRPVAGKGE